MKTRTIYLTTFLSFLLLTSLQCGDKIKKSELKCAEIYLRTNFIRMNAAKTEVEVNVVLHNPTKDTLWFWAMSCWSPQNRLIFDENKFQDLYRIQCEDEIPEVTTVLLGEQLEIPVMLHIKKKTNWLRIGFNLVKSEQYYSRDDIRLMDIPSNFMDKGKIIWADAISLK